MVFKYPSADILAAYAALLYSSYAMFCERSSNPLKALGVSCASKVALKVLPPVVAAAAIGDHSFPLSSAAAATVSSIDF